VWGFPATSWTLVRRARSGDERSRDGALEALCRAYWRPLYAYARVRGLARADAQDAVQDFFATSLRRELFQRAEEAAGTLRTYLLTALKHHLSDRAAKEGAERRRPAGGWAELDFETAEAEWARSARGVAGSGPDAAYERQWARALLAEALARVETRYAAEGKRAVFLEIKGEALEGAGEGQAERGGEGQEGAGGLAMSAGARRVAVHRLRKRFAEALREAVAATLPEGGDVDAELRELGAALAEGRA
jgi:RNA polymerase sigma-70 factor (ECF subfamily)